MPGYVCLMKYTQQGLASIKDSPERMRQGRALAEQLGAKVVGVWVTMGQYDLVAVGDFPNDQAVATWSLMMGRSGNVTTESMRALSEDEFAQLVGKLP